MIRVSGVQVPPPLPPRNVTGSPSIERGRQSPAKISSAVLLVERRRVIAVVRMTRAQAKQAEQAEQSHQVPRDFGFPLGQAALSFRRYATWIGLLRRFRWAERGQATKRR